MHNNRFLNIKLKKKFNIRILFIYQNINYKIKKNNKFN